MADSNTVQAGEMPADISSSLGSLWKQYSGERPADIQTEIRGTKIACVLKDAVGGFADNLTLAARRVRKLPKSQAEARAGSAL